MKLSSAEIKDYAEMGYSKTAVASILDVPLSTLYHYLTKMDLHGKFVRANYRDECRGKGTPSIGSGKGPRLSNRRPIFHNGKWWHPGESTHHAIFQGRM